MKRITDMELRELPFGSKIRTIWHNSSHHEKGEEYCGVIFGDKIGWEDGKLMIQELLQSVCLMIGV